MPLSKHIGAKKGEIAEVVLVPGDPLRARWIAQNFLKDIICYSEVRGALGFTGIVKSGPWKGRRVSVQGCGMGMPSNAIYYYELVKMHGAKTLIRVGTCGALTEELKLRDTIIATSAMTDSKIVEDITEGIHFPLVPDAHLLANAEEQARAHRIEIKKGAIYSADLFYNPKKDWRNEWIDRGAIAVEMEAAALFALARVENFTAAAILMVSDIVPTGEEISAEDRESGVADLARLALAM